jgi:hypothetical protein
MYGTSWVEVHKSMRPAREGGRGRGRERGREGGRRIVGVLLCGSVHGIVTRRRACYLAVRDSDISSHADSDGLMQPGTDSEAGLLPGGGRC